MAQFQGLPAPALISSSGGSTDVTGKAVLFYFSAHWCGPCRQFTPALARFYQKHHKEMAVVFVSADRSEGEMEKYYSERRARGAGGGERSCVLGFRWSRR